MTLNISEVLADAYATGGTPKVASAEDLEKNAQLEYFMALTKKANIDLTQMDDKQIDQLWKTAFENGAPPFPPAAAPAGPPAPPSAPPKEEKKEEEKEKKDEEKKEEEKEAAARKEYAEKRAMSEKLAEADAMGRVMAHSYVDELRKISAKLASEGAPPPPPPAAEEKKEEKKEEEKKEASLLERLRKVASQGAAPAAVSSTTANLDTFAGNYAIDLLKQAGVDEQVAVSRINAVHTLGVGESTKVASSASFEQAVHLRALEYCEAAGFPVDWNKA